MTGWQLVLLGGSEDIIDGIYECDQTFAGEDHMMTKSCCCDKPTSACNIHLALY